MAARKARRRGRARGGVGQKIAVGLAAVVLVLCGASVTFSLFVGQSDGGGRRALTIVIKNGSGVPGIAGEAETALKNMAIDVLEVGNADRFDYSESILIGRRRGSEVKRLGEIIGCRNVTIQTRRDAAADAELILGADYRHLRLNGEK
jgi:hypothetical protein